jgi:hypothetical protein
VILSVTFPGYAQEVVTPMALDQSVLSDLLDALKAGGDLDFMRRAMEVVLQALIELEATEKTGESARRRWVSFAPSSTPSSPGFVSLDGARSCVQ